MTILGFEGDDVLFVHDGRPIRQRDNLRLKDGKLVWRPKPLLRGLVTRSSVWSGKTFPKFYPHPYRDIKGEQQGDIASGRAGHFFMVVHLLIAAAIIFSASLITLVVTLFVAMIHDAILLALNMIWMVERVAT
jgi:hypothetical protein